MENLSGKKFFKLTVIEFDKKNNARKYYWKCQCDCGNLVSQRSDALKSGRKKSCGCIQSPNEEDYREKLKNRLLKYSKKIGDCWEYKKRINPNGYGLIKTRYGNKNASRAAWMAWKGEITKGLFVLHKCDNRLCINPDHLFLGTHQDNMNDMMQKNRQNKRPGEKHHTSIFMDEDIVEIRRLWDSGENTQASIARKYNAGIATIHNIVKRKTWKHIP